MTEISTPSSFFAPAAPQPPAAGQPAAPGTPPAGQVDGTAAPSASLRSHDEYSRLWKHLCALRESDRGAYAALARLNMARPMRPHEVSALSNALLAAELQPQHWLPHTWQRWATVVHGMALAGHDGSTYLGRQLAQAGVAQSRVGRLLTARGDAFMQLLPRVLRLLASKNTQPNWRELGPLVLKEHSTEPEAVQRLEEIRLGIARNYFAGQAKLEGGKADAAQSGQAG